MGSAASSKGILIRTLFAFVLAATSLLPGAVPARAGSDTVTFVGGGFGHAVGMSQYGAFGQALEDPSKTGAEIVSHYFAGSSVEPVEDKLPADHFLLGDDAVWVGLLRNRTTLTFVPSGGNVRLCQAGDGEGCPRDVQAEPGETWKLVRSGGSCQFERDGSNVGPAGDCSATLSWDPGTTVRLPQWNDRSVGQGALQVRPVDGAFHVSLALGLEAYTEGIAEMPSSWEPAALEAQAIASRTYVAAKAQMREKSARDADGDPGLSTSRKNNCWCHVRATTADQVYKGLSQELDEKWADAVHRTAGLVLTHSDDAFTQNGIIEAFYFSSSAGVTEDNTTGFGSSRQYPYLVSVDDHWSSDPSINPNARWENTVAVDEILSELRTTSESWRVDFDSLTSVEMVNGPPGAMVRFTGKVGAKTESVEATGRWLKRLGNRSAQITAVESTLGGEPPPPPSSDPGSVELVSLRVDDGPEHDGTGNDSRGNNDGFAQCGEIIELYATATNTGGEALTGVSAKLTESDPYVSIMYNTRASYPDLSPGATAENPKDWDLKISGDTPAGHNAKLTFTYTTDTAGPFTTTAILSVGC